MPYGLRALLLLVALCCALPAAAGDVSERDLQAARERIAAASETLQEKRKLLGTHERALREAERAIAAASRKLADVRRRERDATRRLAELEAEQQKLARQEEQQRAALAADLRATWEAGRESPLRLWLSARDPVQTARLGDYLGYVRAARTQRLAAWQQARAQLVEAQQQTAGEQQRLAGLRTELEGEQRRLADAGEARRKAVAQVRSEVRGADAELKRLKEDAAALQALFESAREAFRDIPPVAPGTPFANRRGKLRWPVAGRLAARFGSALAGGKMTQTGVILAAREGSEVKAVHPGRVVYADWLRGFGLLAIIDHGDGYLTVYGHNRALLRQAGDWVREGDSIATVGDSGGQGTPGLYFEIRHRGEPVDPARWCR